MTAEEGTSWVYKNKDHGMMAASASLGLLYLWDVEKGLAEIDKYLYNNEDYIKVQYLFRNPDSIMLTFY
jgi:26S proteasome regulatory subunit N1